MPIIERCWACGKHVYLPVLSSDRHGRLEFARYLPDSRMLPNRFNIPEPQVVPGSLVSARALDLALTPLVGFDSTGGRLGMGGGYYDRTFAFLRNRRHWKKPHLIGLAYDFQRVSHLERKAWDVPLEAVVTETGIRLCSGDDSA